MSNAVEKTGKLRTKEFIGFIYRNLAWEWFKSSVDWMCCEENALSSILLPEHNLNYDSNHCFSGFTSIGAQSIFPVSCLRLMTGHSGGAMQIPFWEPQCSLTGQLCFQMSPLARLKWSCISATSRDSS